MKIAWSFLLIKPKFVCTGKTEQNKQILKQQKNLN